MTPMPEQYTDYSTLEREKTITLSKSRKVIKYRLLDGNAEAWMSSLKREEKSSHTPMLARRPQEKLDETNWRLVDLDRLPLKDIEELRADMNRWEGKIDTEFVFDHPEKDEVDVEHKKVMVDLIAQTTFFFPSGTIL